ncbi:unnamed protein product, partial [Adineta ricciae]
ADATNSTKLIYIQHNEILANKINETYLSIPTRLNIRLFDCYTFMSKILNDYLAYGFESLDNCWDTESGPTVIVNCKDITKRIFADEFHLTSTLQSLIAKQVYLVLGGSSLSSMSTRLTSMTEYVSFSVVFAILMLK